MITGEQDALSHQLGTRDVQCHVSTRLRCFDQEPYLAHFSSAVLDDRPLSEEWSEFSCVTAQDTGLEAWNVVLRRAADQFEQLSAASVVKEGGRQSFGTPREARQDLVQYRILDAHVLVETEIVGDFARARFRSCMHRVGIGCDGQDGSS